MKTLLITCIFLCGCSITKDRKAVSRVTYNKALFDQVGRQWQLSNPCSIDTVRQFINGQEVIKYDTVNVIDTVINPITKEKVLYNTVTKYITKIDTLRIYVTDLRSVGLIKDDLNKATGEITQLKSDLKSSQSGSNKKTWWIVGISFFSLLVISALTYLLFK